MDFLRMKYFIGEILTAFKCSCGVLPGHGSEVNNLRIYGSAGLSSERNVISSPFE